jgi:glycosyltransferase involved in cell wall biosynthesis
MMRKYFFSGIALIFFALLVKAQDIKIVGLVPVRNEAIFVGNCLRALAAHTDAIIVLDDVSTDGTLDIVKSLVKECRIERIIEKKEWVRNERADKQALLEAGRQIGGTHFIVIDADEIFSAECARDQWLRKTISAMRPGENLIFSQVHSWGDCHWYRNDSLCNHRAPFLIDLVFADDGRCNYFDNEVVGPSRVIHMGRVPANLANHKKIYIAPHEVEHSVIHFRFINLDESCTKIIWYMCLELINKTATDPDHRFEHARAINDFYKIATRHGPLFYGTDVQLAQIPDSWYAYKNFDMTAFERAARVHTSQKNEIICWIKQYGPAFFKDLDIWRVDWINALRDC